MKKSKMVVVMRTDLGMKAGKMVAQGGHAVLTRFRRQLANGDMTILKEWLDTGMKKVCLAVDSEQALKDTINKAINVGVPVDFIVDAGLTQVEPGVMTCCAIGPASEQTMKKITGSLKLLGDVEEETPE